MHLVRSASSLGVMKRMKKHNISKAKGSFAVLQTDGRSQAAVMRLAPGGWSGEKGNEHPQSDQVLFVVRGEVVAEIGDDRETCGKAMW